MKPELRRESERLKSSWNRHASEELDTYLVAEVEDPRINCQSILSRALIGDTFYPGGFDFLINEEWRFGLCQTWIFQRLSERNDRAALYDAIQHGNRAVCPPFLLEAFAALQQEGCPIPDYISASLLDPVREGGGLLPGSALNTFASLWKESPARLPRGSTPAQAMDM